MVCVRPVEGSKVRVSCTIFSPERRSFICLSISDSIAFWTKRKELTFFISTLVPSSFEPFGLMEMFISHRSCPFSMSARDTPVYLIMFLSFSRNSLAICGESMSGSVTISIRGVPALFRSTKVFEPS